MGREARGEKGWDWGLRRVWTKLRDSGVLGYRWAGDIDSYGMAFSVLGDVR